MPRPLDPDTGPSIQAVKNNAEQYLRSPYGSFAEYVRTKELTSAQAYADSGLFPEAVEDSEQRYMLDLLFEIAYRDVQSLYVAMRAFLEESGVSDEDTLQTILRSTTLARHFGSISNADNFATSLAGQAFELRKKFFVLGSTRDDEPVVRFTPDILTVISAFAGKENGCPLIQVKADIGDGARASVYDLYWEGLVEEAHREYSAKDVGFDDSCS